MARFLMGWAGQKTHSGFPYHCMKGAQMNFLAIHIVGSTKCFANGQEIGMCERKEAEMTLRILTSTARRMELATNQRERLWGEWISGKTRSLDCIQFKIHVGCESDMLSWQREMSGDLNGDTQAEMRVQHHLYTRVEGSYTEAGEACPGLGALQQEDPRRRRRVKQHRRWRRSSQ